LFDLLLGAGGLDHVFAWNSEEAGQHTKTASARLAAILSRIFAMATGHRPERRLRLCETLSLGEKRFIAVVEYGKQKFLLAGTPQNISLLQSLDESFGETGRASQPGSDPD
jgi:flagellar biogenesis protein FliO